MRQKKHQESIQQYNDTATKINKELYKRNFELAIRNETLQTLRILYELTNSTLDFKALSERLAHTLTQNLSVELTSIFLLNETKTKFSQVSIATTDSLKEKLKQNNLQLDDFELSALSKTNLIVKSHLLKKVFHTNRLLEVYGRPLDVVVLKKIQSSANLKNIVLYPLYTENRNIGVLVLILNKLKKDITEYEAEDMQRFAEVISLSLDKALVYKDLRIANAQLKELDEAKSEFMSIASHQLRTPLAGIVGYLSMLLEGDYGKLTKQNQPVVSDVFQAAQRLVRLVNTFLNVTRIEAGRFTLTYVPTNIVEMVNDEIKALQPTADKRNLKLIFNSLKSPKSADLQAEVDEKMREVFINLIDNAIKYTQEGSVTVNVEPEGKSDIHLTVTDTGIGIAKGDAEHLFEKFVRGSSVARVQPNGSGLGLYIVKQIVEGHHGKIWAASEGVNKGTTFHVVIPKKQQTKEFKADAKRVFHTESIVDRDPNAPVQQLSAPTNVQTINESVK